MDGRESDSTAESPELSDEGQPQNNSRIRCKGEGWRRMASQCTDYDLHPLSPGTLSDAETHVVSGQTVMHCFLWDSCSKDAPVGKD